MHPTDERHLADEGPELDTKRAVHLSNTSVTRACRHSANQPERLHYTARWVLVYEFIWQLVRTVLRLGKNIAYRTYHKFLDSSAQAAHVDVDL